VKRRRRGKVERRMEVSMEIKLSFSQNLKTGLTRWLLSIRLKNPKSRQTSRASYLPR
jgi:hypothetical protein